MNRGQRLNWNYKHSISFFNLKITLNVSNIPKKTGKILKKRVNFPNACLNGHARLKTGDFGTLVHGVWYMVYGTWCMVHGVWCLVPGVWCMVYGAWCMVYGTWCMVHGAWCMVHSA